MTKVTQITPTELLKRVDSGELWQILDVREPWEIEIAKVAGTMNIPMSEVPARYDELSAALTPGRHRSIRQFPVIETEKTGFWC